MTPIKVGILEDDIIIGMSIADDLQALGYVPVLASDYDQAVELTETEKLDIMLVDIMLGEERDGIDFARFLQHKNIPVIFVTANSDSGIVARAKEARPAAYLLKPFDRNDLYTTIEVAIHNYCNREENQSGAVLENGEPESGIPSLQYRINDAIFIKQGQYLRKIPYSEILYLESDNSYLFIHTADRKMMVRASMASYLDYLGETSFCRVHRSFAIDLQHLESIHNDTVIIGGTEIPIGKIYRADLLNSLRIS